MEQIPDHIKLMLVEQMLLSLRHEREKLEHRLMVVAIRIEALGPIREALIEGQKKAAPEEPPNHDRSDENPA